MTAARFLDRLYIPTRYPDAWSEGSPHYYTRGDAEKALACAEMILDWVRATWSRLSGGAAKRGNG